MYLELACISNLIMYPRLRVSVGVNGRVWFELQLRLATPKDVKSYFHLQSGISYLLIGRLSCMDTNG